MQLMLPARQTQSFWPEKGVRFPHRELDFGGMGSRQKEVDSQLRGCVEMRKKKSSEKIEGNNSCLIRVASEKCF